MDGLADRHDDVLAAGDPDGLGADGERLRAVGREVLRRVGRVHLLLDEVLDVGVDVGHAPGDAARCGPDHAGRAREGHARRRRRGRPPRPGAVEAVDVPDRRHVEAEMGVVGEERGAARRRDGATTQLLEPTPPSSTRSRAGARPASAGMRVRHAGRARSRPRASGAARGARRATRRRRAVRAPAPPVAPSPRGLRGRDHRRSAA